jgi:tetratricopeptide (TPR) repeat protein
MRGPLLFDDLTLPLASPLLIGEPLLRWISGVRPLLMLTYWINYDPAASTLSYHLTNVLLHALNAMLVFCLGQHLFARHIVESTRVLVATSFTTLLFLLHPLQTESVSYIAGRSELLSATFVLIAWLAYVRRIGRAITGRQASLILFLFILAGAAKEQSVATIPAILLLTDWVFGPRSLWAEVKRNWRLYAPMTAAAAIGASVVAAIVQGARSVGASTGVNSLEYFLTQCRAMLLYLRLFVLPIGQNADRDFPISRSLNEHGAAFALIVVLALLVLAFRVKMPLVRYGALLFFALLAPTSSFIPLADPFAERRMYLPILGLAIALTGALVRLPIPTPRLAWTSALVPVLAFCLTAQRASIWSDGVLFWSDVVSKSPAKDRGYSHLINAYMMAGRCNEAVEHMRKAGSAVPRDYFIAFNWARAYACAKQPKEALAMMQEAERLNPTADVYGSMGDILWAEGRTLEAHEAYTTALAKQPPGTDLNHVYKGHLALLANNRAEAEKEYGQALAINPYCPEATSQLRRLQAASSGQHSLPPNGLPRNTYSPLVNIN